MPGTLAGFLLYAKTWQMWGPGGEQSLYHLPAEDVPYLYL